MTGRDAIVPVVDEGLGNSSYVVDLGDGRALVVDPGRDPSPYLDAAERRHLRVAFSAETHLHADFVSGSREFAAHRAVVIAARAARIEFSHRGLVHGDEIDLGGLTLRALATPGHTPEHLSYLLLDDSRPVALFSGGSLLVGAVARTDLIAPDQTEVLARELWRSLHEHILVLPDDLPVFPTHGSGSFCSAPAGAERVTTVGRERTANPLLSAPDEDTFVERLLAGLGTYPTYFRELREVNRRGPRVVGRFPQLGHVGVSDLDRHVATGGALVDVRPFGRFAAGHIPGSLSIEWRPQFASWLGWLVDRRQRIAFVCDLDTDRARLVSQCLTVGYEELAGELAGGVAEWSRHGRPLETIALVGPRDLDGRRVLDIRQDAEFSAGHVPGALHVELGVLAQKLAAVPDGPVAVMCGHGERAMTGASILAAGGRRDVAVLAGGPSDWADVTGGALRA